ncbi:MAG: TIGR02206 family membrane protein [Chloroflexi bacterium]|nr:TIGR02206 family membrane protein [Chloroflexota bacterium]
MDLSQYFIKDYTGAGFVLFGPAHLATILVIIVFILFLTRFKGASDATRKKLRWTLAILIWTAETSWHVWNLAIGTWNIQTMLPLHMCSVLIWLTGFMLINKNYSIYEFVYFLGIGGALQALLTPDVGIYGFPHFRYFQTFMSHGLLVGAGVYMTVVEGFRPTWKSILRIFVIANIYMLIIFFVNSAIGSNYLMINGKPPMASIMDLLPAWPYYIPWLEVIALITCLLLYLPFMIKDWFAKPATA